MQPAELLAQLLLTPAKQESLTSSCPPADVLSHCNFPFAMYASMVLDYSIPICCGKHMRSQIFPKIKNVTASLAARAKTSRQKQANVSSHRPQHFTDRSSSIDFAIKNKRWQQINEKGKSWTGQEVGFRACTVDLARIKRGADCRAQDKVVTVSDAWFTSTPLKEFLVKGGIFTVCWLHIYIHNLYNRVVTDILFRIQLG
jgi:hypothetical protein